jgi:hypothetical protein
MPTLGGLFTMRRCCPGNTPRYLIAGNLMHDNARILRNRTSEQNVSKSSESRGINKHVVFQKVQAHAGKYRSSKSWLCSYRIHCTQ